MIREAFFYTVSMARLCARQGYLEKSAEIYRFLLETEPDRKDLQEALADVEARLSTAAEPPAAAVSSATKGEPGRLEGLIQQWIGLLVEKDIKQRFDNIRGRMRQADR